MERLKGFIKGTGALAAIIGLLVGVPLALVTFVGWPLPRVLPVWDDVSWHLTNGQVPDEFWIKAITCLLWLVWLQLAWAIVVEVVAAARHRTSRRPLLVLPGFHGLAVRLVGAAMLISTVTTSTGPPVEALSVSSLPAVTQDIGMAATTTTARPVPDGRFVEKVDLDRALDDQPTHTVESRRESLWALAEQYLGDGARWEEVRDLNLGRRMADGTVFTEDVMRLRTGWELVLPADAVLEPKADVVDPVDEDVPHPGDDSLDDAEPGFDDGVYTVESGDHFWAMAEARLTAAWGRTPTDSEVVPYWLELVDVNRDRLAPPHDPDLIHPDEIYEIPEAPPDPLAPPPERLDEPVPEPSDPSPAPSSSNGADPDGGARPGEHPPGPAQVAPPVSRPDRRQLDGPVAEPVPAGRATVDDGGIDPLTALGGTLTLVGGGVLGAMLLWRLARLREWQLRRRRPGDRLPVATDIEVEAEQQIRRIADHHAVEWLDATNRMLAASAGDAGVPPPPLICARAGTLGLELLLAEPVETPLPGFVAEDDGKLWRVDPSLSIAEVHDRAATGVPVAPALVSIGERDGADVLIDVERIGALSIDGTPAVAMGFLTALAAGLTSAPWSEGVQVDVVTLEPDPSLIALGARVVDPSDRPEIERLIADANSSAARLAGSSAHGVRCRPGAIDVLPPTVVLVGRDHPMVASELSAAATQAGSGLAVVAACPVPGVVHRIELQGERRARLEPLGLDFELITMSPAMVAATVELYESARRLSAAPPVDPTPSVSSGPVAPALDGEPTPAGPVEPVLEVEPSAVEPSVAEPVLSGPVEPVLEVEASAVEPSVAEPAPARSAEPALEVEASAVEPSVVEPVPSGPAGDEPVVPDRPGRVGGELDIPALAAASAVDIRFLGPPIVVGDEIDIGGRSVEILAFLAANSENRVDGERIAEAVYRGDISPGGLRNAMTKTRKALGTDADGNPRLEAGSRWTGFSLGSEIGCDWWRFQSLVAAADRLAGDAAIMAYTAALQLVRGRPFDGAPKDRYGWVTEDRQLLSQIEVAVTDAADRLGRLALGAGNGPLAEWAAEIGLLVVPYQEGMYRLRMEARDISGDPDGVRQAFTEAQRAAQSFDPLEDVLPETRELYERLLHTRRQGDLTTEPEVPSQS